MGTHHIASASGANLLPPSAAAPLPPTAAPYEPYGIVPPPPLSGRRSPAALFPHHAEAGGVAPPHR